MYYLTVWDKCAAAEGLDGCVKKMEVPAPISEFLFALDPAKFPLLSSLSFDDYGLFSGETMGSLVEELRAVVRIRPSWSEVIVDMLNMVLEAQSLGKSVLFDPFRHP